MIDTPTWKKCRGIIDLFTVGFILPNWADCQVEMFDDGKFNVSNHHIPNAAISVGYHDRNQYGNTIFKDYGHIKFDSPWFLREKTGVQFPWNPCLYHDTNQKDIIQILPGVMDYKYQMSTNVNMFIKKGSIAKFYAGDPLVHIIPISEKKVKLHHHLLSEEEYQKVISLDVNAGMYVNTRKVKSPTESKCPFGFGK